VGNDLARVTLFDVMLHPRVLADRTALNCVLTTSAEAGFI
jgi:hypothetical protein